MDHSASKEHDSGFDLDLESGTGIIHSNIERSVDPDLDKKLAKTVFLKLCDGLMSVDESLVKSDLLNVNEGSLESVMKCKKGPSAKKPPRPPRPFSLDASDQKLIKELAELAMMKRARIERMKALKQKKNSKISLSSSSSSSHGSFIAMLFTIIFLLVILFQGQNSGGTIQRSPQTGQGSTNGLTVVQNQFNLSPSNSVSANYKSSTGY
ncbi:hypothetical protein L1987_81346 [Smallanthus sonchifolius]|uniref:Uncharacterized protein n=1 Tax=Smallanthus sonchifolius TaxID=185202 RepID=A0ACB8YQY0_9ASTR|nr:hypothetical protein L1987_81346 [Smallanthus sonchifolius]